MIKAKVERTYLAPEIVEAKGKATAALDELTRGHRSAMAMLRRHGGLKDELAPITAPQKKHVPPAAPKPATKQGEPTPMWIEG